MNKIVGPRIMSCEILKPADQAMKPDSHILKKPKSLARPSSSKLWTSEPFLKPTPKNGSIEHLIKNKFFPVSSTKTSDTQRIVSAEGSSQNANKQNTGITKNFVINGKSLPLKVVKIIPGTHSRNVTHNKMPPNTDSNNDEDDPNNDILTELENLKKKVKGLASGNYSFPFPLKNVEAVLKFDKDFKENRSSMTSLVNFLKRAIPLHYESVIEELLPVIFTDEAIEGFNFTGKGKKSFKKLSPPPSLPLSLDVSESPTGLCIGSGTVVCPTLLFNPLVK